MKPIQQCTINGKTSAPSDMELLVTLNGAGRGFLTVVTDTPETSLCGALVQIDVGQNTEAWRYFTGYVERDQPAENGARRLFIREAAGILEFDFPCAFQHPTLKTVLDFITNQSGIVFVIPDADYATTKIPHFTHSGSGINLLAQLGRSFSIPDYVWHPMPDGSVYVGSAKDSRFAGMAMPSIPSQYIIARSGGNSASMMLMAAMRPGVNLPEGRVTRVSIKDAEMTLTWEKIDTHGNPVSKSPQQRQIERLYPELADGGLRPRLARVIAPTEGASLGDAADPFRPRYAVDVQVLDEQGQDRKGTPVYAAVPLPVPMAGPESGIFSYPPPGTLVEVALVEGRPDKPVIRQILAEGQNLPAVKPGEQLQQQRAEVFQRVTQTGSWERETDQQIQERSAVRDIASDEETRVTTTRTTTIKAKDETTVLGSSTLLAGSVVQIADDGYSLAAGDQLLMKAKRLLAELDNADITIEAELEHNVGGDATHTTGGRRVDRTKGEHAIEAKRVSISASSVFIGQGTPGRGKGLNLLTLLIDTLDLINQLAEHTASHTHSNTGAPTNSGALQGDAQAASRLKSKYSNMIA
ncbi:MAG: hypothetical protein ACRC4K_02050 [Plesiomonas shigelloides]